MFVYHLNDKFAAFLLNLLCLSVALVNYPSSAKDGGGSRDAATSKMECFASSR